jgi:hypothetical protein
MPMINDIERLHNRIAELELRIDKRLANLEGGIPASTTTNKIGIGDVVRLSGFYDHFGTVKGVADRDAWVKWAGNAPVTPHAIWPVSKLILVEKA